MDGDVVGRIARAHGSSGGMDISAGDPHVPVAKDRCLFKGGMRNWM